MAPSSRGAARRYADQSRRRRTNRVMRAPAVSPDGSEAQAAPPSSVVPPSSGASAERPLGETRVTIAPRFRAAAATRPSTFESTDYGYVLGDLRRVMIVAGSLVIALIVLSLVIR